MKKVFYFILFFCASLQINAQQVYNEEGKYYEYAYIWYDAKYYASGNPYIIASTTFTNMVRNENTEYKDENGNKVVFNNYIACINYFMAKGWTVLNIVTDLECSLNHHNENRFLIRREISKEQAEKLASECIKELKPSKK